MNARLSSRTARRYDGRVVATSDETAPVEVDESTLDRELAETAMRSTGALPAEEEPEPAPEPEPESEADKARRLLVRRADVASFVEYVLDASIVGLLSESAAGAWSFEDDDADAAADDDAA